MTPVFGETDGTPPEYESHRPIKVAVLTPTISRNGGGLMDAVRRPSQVLALDDRFDLSVLSIADEYAEADRAEWAPLSPVTFSHLGPLQFGYSHALARALDRLAPDIVHVHGLWHFNSIVARDYSRRTGRPHVVSPHGMLDRWALNHSARRKRLASAAFERAHLREAACLHALCEPERDSIRAFGVEAPICLVPNGVDLPASRQRADKQSPETRRQQLLYLGRLHPKKGLTELLHGWATFRAADPAVSARWELVVAGWSQLGYEKDLRELATALSISDSVSFLGPLYGTAKVAAFSAASAFILPSKSEGLPLVVLEAWAHGLPVLMTPECNLPDGFAVGAALRIDPSPSSIANGLLTLSRLDSESHTLAGSRGRGLVERRYTWRIVAQQHKQVYEWLAHRRETPVFVDAPPSRLVSSFVQHEAR